MPALRSTGAGLAVALSIAACGVARADTTTAFPAEGDEFDYYIYTLPIPNPPPYMTVQGDAVRGQRAADDDTVVAVSYELHANNEYTFCDGIYVEFFVDGQKVDTIEMDAVNADQVIEGSWFDLVDTTRATHTLEIVRSTPYEEDCGSIQWDKGEGWVTLHTLAGPNDDDDDGYDTTTDCDDTDPLVHPGAAEICDGTDQDCDASVDEGVIPTWYRDTDGDGVGSQVQQTQACQKPQGYSATYGDCDNNDPAVFPGNHEVCDLKDNDCDLETDEGVDIPTFYRDSDSDGYGDAGHSAQACSVPSGYVSDPFDCDDTQGSVHPGASEACNGIDEDCDTRVDEGVKSPWYADDDGDGYGDPHDSTQACSKPGGHVANATDCDDGQASVHPGAAEVCGDGIDQDCSGADLGCGTVDDDGDGQSPSQGDCDDHDATIYSGATEIPYDGIDQDCSGADLTDVDGDGYDGGDGGPDCNDSNAAINPGKPEVCNGKDDNCDGQVDDRDADGDGYVSKACFGPDCDDTRASVHPGADEVTDGVDNDCDGAVDEHLLPLTPTPEETPTEAAPTPTEPEPETPTAADPTPGSGTPQATAPEGTDTPGAPTATAAEGTPGPSTPSPTPGEEPSGTPGASPTPGLEGTPTDGQATSPVEATPAPTEIETPGPTEAPATPSAEATEAAVTTPPGTPTSPDEDGGCQGGCSSTSGAGGGAGLWALVVGMFGVVRRRRSRA